MQGLNSFFAVTVSIVFAIIMLVLVFFPVVKSLSKKRFEVFVSKSRSEFMLHTIANASRVTAEVIQPSSVWPLILISAVLIATVDSPYFPTAPFITGYVTMMIYHGYLSITFNFQAMIKFVIAAVAWIIIGAIWLGVKWWSFLRDPKNATMIIQIPDGTETQFFIGRLGYLYPHFVYWPLSIPHTILTKLVYQIFEHVARRWSSVFGRMVRERKTELADQAKTR